MPSRKSLIIDCVILFVAWVCLIASLAGSIMSNEAVWFQRSGSLLVLFSVVMEIRQTLAGRPQKSPRVSSGGRPILTERPITAVNRNLHWIARGGIVLGTLVWGYGDLILGAIS